MTKSKEAIGSYSLIASWLTVAILAYVLGGYTQAFSGLTSLLTGNVTALGSQTFVPLTVIAVVLAAVAIELPFAYGAGVFALRSTQNTTEHAVSSTMNNMEDGNHFFIFFILVVVEELFARWFFLGILPMIPFLSGTVAFYALFLIGNGIWAVIHLTNFKEGERDLIKVLPQFIAGIFYTYVFVEFGLMAAILAHFMGNALLFAGHRVQNINWVDALIVAYWAGLFVVAWSNFDQPLSDVTSWFSGEYINALDGWDKWDYLWFSLISSSVIGFILGVLCYDRGQAGKGDDVPLWLHLVAIPIAVIIMYALYWVLGFVTSNETWRVLSLAVLLSFGSTTASGSAMARVFWMQVPALYLSMCILLALGFFTGMWWLALVSLIQAPRTILVALDD